MKCAAFRIECWALGMRRGFPSLALLAPRPPSFLDAARTADFLAAGDCRIAVVEARQLSSFRQRAENLGLDLSIVGRAAGFNLGNGRWVTLRLFAVGKGGTE